MGHYDSWCDFCGKDNSFSGYCYCEKAKEYRLQMEKKYEEEKAQQHAALVAAKQFLRSLGFDPGIKEYWDFDAHEFTKDKEKIIKCWINDDKFKFIDFVSIVSFIKKANGYD